MVTVDGENVQVFGQLHYHPELLDRPTDPMAVRLFVLQAPTASRLILLMKRWLLPKNGWNTLKEALILVNAGVCFCWQTTP